MKIKQSTLTDIIFCVLVMPGMMFLFPLGEWMLWHPWYVTAFILWMYVVYFVCRRVLGALLWNGRKWIGMVAGAVFLLGVVNFGLSLTPVDFPQESTRPEALELYQRAMWLLFIATVSFGLVAGALLSRIKVLEEGTAGIREENRTLATLGHLGSQAFGNDTISVKSGYRDVSVPLSHIQYIESRNNYACLHIDNRDDVLTQISLKDLLERLPSKKFMRIHRSYVVPLWRISASSVTEVSLIGVPEPLPVGRSYKENVKKFSCKSNKS